MYSGLLSLKNEWNKLIESGNYSIFSKWEWLSTWWKHFGNDKQLVLLLAEDSNKIIGIAPLMYSLQKMFGFTIGKISFIGTPHSDYNDFIIVDRVEECLRLFIKYLNNLPENWNCMELTEIPEESKCIATLSKMSKTFKPLSRCSYTKLPKSYNAFLTSLGSNTRRNLRRYFKMMKKNFEVEFMDYSETQSCVEGMHHLFDLHQKSWKSRGFPGIFADQKSRDFHLDIARSFAQKGWLGLFILKLSDEPVAAVYGFKDGVKFYFYIMGFDPKYSKYRVGSQLIAYVISRCIEDGLLEFDFMRGEEVYKNLWNTTSRLNRVAVILRSRFSSNLQYWLYMKLQEQRNRLNSLVGTKML